MSITASVSSSSTLLHLNVVLVVGGRRLTQVATDEAVLVTLGAQDAMVILGTLTAYGMRSTNHMPHHLRLLGICSILLLQLVIKLTEVEIAGLAGRRVRALVRLLKQAFLLPLLHGGI